MLGNVDSGKSTLLGVLTQGELDNGRGRARLNLFRHLHEIQTGRTSSISFEILGFNSKGEVRDQRLYVYTKLKLISFIYFDVKSMCFLLLPSHLHCIHIALCIRPGILVWVELSIAFHYHTRGSSSAHAVMLSLMVLMTFNERPFGRW